MGKRTASKVVDLSNCEEAIHIPGSIQPHGVLLVLQEPELLILQVSANVETFFGCPAQELLNQSLAILLGTAEVRLLQESLQIQDVRRVNPLRIRARVPAGEMVFDGILHRNDGLLLLELEESDLHTRLQDLYRENHLSIEKLCITTSLQQLYQVVVEEVQAMIGFDHVMMYCFDQQWNGTVIAEARREGIASFLGLCFPASDIPPQARELYRQNWLRSIDDVDYQPSSILPTDNPVTCRPLNLSFSILRSVSPIHLEYLRNMGIRASLSITLLKEKAFWGLIVCHNTLPRHVAYERRMSCELLGRVVSAQLCAKIDYEENLYEMQIRTNQAQLVRELSKEENLVDGLAKHGMKALALVNADGIAICFEDRYVAMGAVPQEEDVRQLVAWLRQRDEGDVFHSNTLPLLYKAAEHFRAVGSGLLAIPVSKVQDSYILWFRPEVAQTVKWGGNPDEVVVTQDLRVHPRRSFELWKQTISMTALPWKPCEVAAVLELRSVFLDMVLHDIVLRQTLNSWLNHS